MPILSQLSTAYIELSRNTAALDSAFLSLLWLASYRFGSIVRGLCCGRFDFSWGGSYMAESFRSGLEAVSQTGMKWGCLLV